MKFIPHDECHSPLCFEDGECRFECRKKADEIVELWMCESKSLLLHDGVLYRFKYDSECESCQALKREYQEGWKDAGL